jgi:DNA invertase Pin-like site-specific DNA recombinase
MSIGNQKDFLVSYVSEKGWELKDIYIDDGFSGTNFDRPEFKRMLGDIESKKINCVITKDLSRLGRNYTKTGYYTDEYFPKHGVRYIALNDSVDSIIEDNDIIPFKHILNEMYAKDISKKVKTAFLAKAKQGQFLGSFAPYGYKKDPENKNKLIADEEVRHIVKRIFKMYAEGCSANHIAKLLSEDKILCPMAQRYKNLNREIPYKKAYTIAWSPLAIRRILSNECHIGNMVNSKNKKISFKSKLLIATAKEERILV